LRIAGADSIYGIEIMETDMTDRNVEAEFIEMAADIVSAFVSHNAVPAGELPTLIQSVHTAIQKIAGAKAEEPVEQIKTPAVPIKKSIADDYLICLEDGKKFKSLKRHLRTQYNMSPNEYREKWGLSGDYPMVAPNNARARSALAKEMGLGQQRKKAIVARAAPAAAPAPEPSAAAAPKKGRGRPKTVKNAA
jgi:predicted transcriptional regulator